MGKTGRGGRRNQKLNKPTPHLPTPAPPSPPENSVVDSPPPEECTGRTLPEEIVLEILSRTPAKSLVRFKCVCKSWLATLLHPKFIAMHLNINILRNEKLLVQAYTHNANRGMLCFLSVNDPPIYLHKIKTNLTYKSDFPTRINFLDFSKHMVLAGSINGILCLSNSEEMLGDYVVLWNPAINHWKPIKLPEPKSSYDNVGPMSVGFGFDAAANDYKIIRIVPVSIPPDFEDFWWSRVEIYSVNRDMWQDVDDGALIAFWPKLPNCNFIVNGIPYWVGIDDKPEDIEKYNSYQLEILGKFDPCTGLYTKVPYPEHVKNESTWVHPVKLMDLIATLIQSPGESPNPLIDIFVLDENSAEWTKIDTIGPFLCDGLRIPQCFNTGEIVLETWTGDIMMAQCVPFFYDLITQCVTRNKGIDAIVPLWYESYSHVESLVCVKGMELLGEENKNKKKLKHKNWTKLLAKDCESMLHLN